MSDLTRFRDHCRRMATATHARDCTGAKAKLPRWNLANDASHLSLADPGEPATCTGQCLTPADRALWVLLADEVDRYLAGPVLPSDADHDPIDYDDPIDEYRQHHQGA